MFSQYWLLLLFCALQGAMSTPVPRSYHLSAPKLPLENAVTAHGVMTKKPKPLPPQYDESGRDTYATATPLGEYCNHHETFPSIYLLRKPYSLFTSSKSHDCPPTAAGLEAWNKESANRVIKDKSPAAYAVIQSLNHAERLLAPVIILFAMVWLAVVGVGIVEGVNQLWRRWIQTERANVLRGMEGEYDLEDDYFLEEVVISLVHMDEEDDEDEDEDETKLSSWDASAEKRPLE